MTYHHKEKKFNVYCHSIIFSAGVKRHWTAGPRGNCTSRNKDSNIH